MPSKLKGIEPEQWIPDLADAVYPDLRAQVATLAGDLMMACFNEETFIRDATAIILALQILMGQRAAECEDAHKLSYNELWVERDELLKRLAALQKRISDAPKVDAFIDIEGNMAFAKPIIGENLRLRRGDVFQVAFLKLEAPEASEKEHPCPAKSR